MDLASGALLSFWLSDIFDATGYCSMCSIWSRKFKKKNNKAEIKFAERFQ